MADDGAAVFLAAVIAFMVFVAFGMVKERNFNNV